jgi:hypothetical protein
METKVGMKGKYLITTDAWFYAPDGKQYKAAWGEVKILEDNTLGLKTNRNSTNWFAKVGSDQNHIIIAGCQIHYAIKCEEKPNTGKIDDWITNDNGINKYIRPTTIYVAQ